MNPGVPPVAEAVTVPEVAPAQSGSVPEAVTVTAVGWVMLIEVVAVQPPVAASVTVTPIVPEVRLPAVAPVCKSSHR